MILQELKVHGNELENTVLAFRRKITTMLVEEYV